MSLGMDHPPLAGAEAVSPEAGVEAGPFSKPKRGPSCPVTRAACPLPPPPGWSKGLNLLVVYPHWDWALLLRPQLSSLPFTSPWAHLLPHLPTGWGAVPWKAAASSLSPPRERPHPFPSLPAATAP